MAAQPEELDKYAAAEAEVLEEIRHIAAWRLENARRALIVKLNPDLEPKPKPKKEFETPASPVDERFFRGMWVWVEVVLIWMLLGFVVRGVRAEEMRVEVRWKGVGRTEIRCRGDVGVCADEIGVQGPRVVGMERVVTVMMRRRRMTRLKAFLRQGTGTWKREGPRVILVRESLGVLLVFMRWWFGQIDLSVCNNIARRVFLLRGLIWLEGRGISRGRLGGVRLLVDISGTVTSAVEGC